MASRNRTQKFKEFRDDLKASVSRSPETTPDDMLLPSNEVVINMPQAATPKWMPLVDEIKVDIVNIEKKMSGLEVLHSDHLIVRFDDDNAQEQQIQILTAEITHRFQQANRKLKKLVPDNTPAAVRDNQIKKNIRVTLATQLQQLSFDFRRKQREYLEKVKGRQSQSTDIFAVPDRYDGGQPELVDKGFTAGQLEIVATHQTRHQDRTQDIQDIVKSITELAEIMDDLRMLVVDQGTILDRIDYNLEQVESMVEESVSVVIDAHETQKNSRTKTCIMGLCIAVFVLCIMLIGKFLWRSI